MEEDYNLEDALFVACLIKEFIRRSDRVKIACIAQLVNVIAPIRAEKGGPAWRQTIYYAFQFASPHGRGTALDVRVDAPTYDSEVKHDVSHLDVAAVHDARGATVSVFIVNRHLEEIAELDMAIGGFDSCRLLAHETMGGGDLRQPNSAGAPDRVAPSAGERVSVENGRLTGALPPLSYHVIRLACV